ncbi:MAG: hypothetical protein HOE90_15380 [Bacteriovoracaceae bacterium]|jgi:hypothetical protein|nr:hypothetical protein [Bacteriovoracaceae bacterium]
MHISHNQWAKKVLFFMISLLISTQLAFSSAGNIPVRKVDKLFKSFGVGVEYSYQSFKNLEKEFGKRLTKTNDDIGTENKALKKAERKLEEAKKKEVKIAIKKAKKDIDKYEDKIEDLEEVKLFYQYAIMAMKSVDPIGGRLNSQRIYEIEDQLSELKKKYKKAIIQRKKKQKVYKQEIESLERQRHELLGGGQSLESMIQFSEQVALEEVFVIQKRLLYGLISEETISSFPFFKIIFSLFHQFETYVDYINPEDIHSIIDKEQALKEAGYLKDPETFGPISFDQISQMSYEQISELDVSPRNPVWHTKKYMAEHQNPYSEFETWVEDSVQSEISDKYKEKYQGEYKLKKARKVLFFSKIKSNDSNPKINSKDAFGYSWKVKWGSETQSETVAGRLYMKLGAKYTDPLYAAPFMKKKKDGTFKKDPLTLILDKKPADYQPRKLTGKVRNFAKECNKVYTTEELVICLKASKYKFNLAPYILESGTITDANYKDILKEMPSDIMKKKYKKSKQAGRDYVRFVNASVEFRGSNSMHKGGPAAYSSMGANDNRAGRGTGLFNLLIWNIDVRDQNNKNFIFEGFESGSPLTYIESQTDLGATMGGKLVSAKMNSYKTDTNFVERKRRAGSVNGIQHYKLKFKQFTLYRPMAWMAASHSDMLWMAKKIAKLTDQDIADAVKVSKWPNFMKRVYEYKIQNRRNRIAELYGLPVQVSEGEFVASPELAAPSFKRNLSTAKLRRSVEAEYGLAEKSIDLAMVKGKIMDLAGKPLKKKFRGENGELRFVDKLVKDGKVVNCGKTVLTGLLQSTQFPAGLQRRTSRFTDSRGLKECWFGHHPLRIIE